MALRDALIPVFPFVQYTGRRRAAGMKKPANGNDKGPAFRKRRGLECRSLLHAFETDLQHMLDDRFLIEFAVELKIFHGRITCAGIE